MAGSHRGVRAEPTPVAEREHGKNLEQRLRQQEQELVAARAQVVEMEAQTAAMQEQLEQIKE